MEKQESLWTQKLLEGHYVEKHKKETISSAIKEMCIEANHFLSEDMAACIKKVRGGDISSGKADIGSASGESSDRRGRYDTDLSGYGDGSSVCK